MTETTTTIDVGAHYARGRARITELVGALSIDELATPVAACPGWSVADVVSHMTGIVEDALAGRLSGPPDETQTDEQVRRHRGRPIADVLADWSASGPAFEDVLTSFQIWPALIDVTTHEHDVRAALRRSGYRNDQAVDLTAIFMTEVLDLDELGVLTVTFPDARRFTSGGIGPAIGLRTTPFEVLRLRLGRRTRDETLALDWTGDPTQVLDRVFNFGPTEVSLGE